MGCSPRGHKESDTTKATEHACDKERIRDSRPDVSSFTSGILTHSLKQDK